jgi:capsular polysaccharide transport system permease protein
MSQVMPVKLNTMDMKTDRLNTEAKTAARPRTDARVAELRRALATGDFSTSHKIAMTLCRDEEATRRSPFLEPLLFALLASGEREGARTVAMSLPQAEQFSPVELRVMSSAAAASGRMGLASLLGAAAAARDPDNADFRVHLASLLTESRQLYLAREMAIVGSQLDPTRADVFRILSAIHGMSGATQSAIDAIEKAIFLAPELVDYRLHASGIYVDNAQPESAIFHLTHALSKDPECHLAWRLLSAAFLSMGKIQFAIDAAVQASKYSELHLNYKEDLLLHYGHELRLAGSTQSLAAADTTEEFTFDRLKFAGLQSKRSFLGAFKTQANVIWALLLRESLTIYSTSSLGYLWAILEPLTHLALLYVVFVVIGHSSQPPIGNNMLVFYFSGLLPYLFFSHGSERAMHVIVNNTAILGFPQVSLFDIIFARTLLSAITDIIILIIVFAIFMSIGFMELPGNVLDIIFVYCLLLCLTLGMAFINSIMSSFLDAWEKIWPTFLRVQYFSCGIFYHPSSMPDWLRDILSYNPLYCLLEWFREGFFPAYVSEYGARGYAVTVCLVVLALGGCVLLATERWARRHA